MVGSQNVGIILKSYVPQVQKLLVFDERLGKIECIPYKIKDSYRLSHGVFIAYFLQQQRMNYKILDVDILGLPVYWSHSNFYFFHHVLELCYYFLPMDNEASEVFQLLKVFYQNPEKLEANLSKKLFLCKFFIKLGIYPDETLKYDSRFISLISGTIDNNLSLDDERIVNSYIKKWILSCLSENAYMQNFKTINFLKILDIYE